MPIQNRILTVPNQLTFLRLAFLPFFIIAIKYDRYDWRWEFWCSPASATGSTACSRADSIRERRSGAYLDPIADKLLLSSSYFVLALKGKIGWWLAIMVLGRDVLILVACAVILLTVGYRPFPPSIWGKATTFFEISLVMLVLLLAVWGDEPLRIMREVCAYSVAAFVVISGIHYSIVVARRLQETPASPAAK